MILVPILEMTTNKLKKWFYILITKSIIYPIWNIRLEMLFMANERNKYGKDVIEKIKNGLIETYNPKYIYLFGSYAWGTPNSDSDIDFFIVIEDSPLSMSSRMRLGYASLSDIPVPLDIIVYTVKELNEKKDHPSSLSYKILQKGVKLYEAA